jgi:hypothetical protein
MYSKNITINWSDEKLCVNFAKNPKGNYPLAN